MKTKVVYFPSTSRTEQERYEYVGETARKTNRNDRKLSKKIRKGKYETAFKLRQAKNSLYRRQLKARPTKAELVFMDYLKSTKVPFVFQKGFLHPFHRILDFYIPGKMIGFEIDGGYHLARAEKDRHNDQRYLETRGIKVYRFKNEQVFDGSFKGPTDYILGISN